MKLAYPFIATAQASGDYLSKFVDFEEAFTEGATLEEAVDAALLKSVQIQ